MSITIENFRSIKKSRVPISSPTILLGPNNEGKSNFLRALVLSMRTALGLRARAIRRMGITSEDVYEWERDFPIQLQESTPEGESIFVLEFELSAVEAEEFRDLAATLR